MQNSHILRGKMNQKMIFCVQNFLQKLLVKNLFFFKIVLFSKSFFIRVRRVVKILIQDLTRRKNFSSNSDALECFISETDALENFFSETDKIFFCEIWFLSHFSGSG